MRRNSAAIALTVAGRGYLSDGKPTLYVIEAMKLYLFYSTANRDAFLMNRSASIEAAESRWATLSKGLTGPAPAASSFLEDASAQTGDAEPQ